MKKDFDNLPALNTNGLIRYIFLALSLFFLSQCLQENTPNAGLVLSLFSENPQVMEENFDYKNWTGCTVSVLKSEQHLGYFCIKENYSDCSKDSFVDMPNENFRNAIISNLDVHDLSHPICASSIESARNLIFQTNPPASFQMNQSFSDNNLNLGSISLWKDCSRVGKFRSDYSGLMDLEDRSFAMSWKMILANHGNIQDECLETLLLTEQEFRFYQNTKQEIFHYGIH